MDSQPEVEVISRELMWSRHILCLAGMLIPLFLMTNSIPQSSEGYILSETQ